MATVLRVRQSPTVIDALVISPVSHPRVMGL